MNKTIRSIVTIIAFFTVCLVSPSSAASPILFGGPPVG